MIDVVKVKSSIETQENNNRKDGMIETIQKNPSAIIQKKIDIIDGDKEEKGIIQKGIVKEILERKERQQGNGILSNSKETLHKVIDIEKERNMIRKEKDNENDGLIKVVNKEDNHKKSNSLKEEIDEKLKSIERTMDYTRDNSLVKLAKKIEILNSPIEIKEMKKEITILEIIELSDNEKPNRHITNIICHKCKEYGHTKKQCDRHNKIVKQVSKLEFEKDIINVLMEIFNVKQKEIDQVMKKEELKSTNPLKINKRKRKQKDIIMKLIENLPNHHKDKKEYLLKLKDSIEIPIACIKCRKYGHHVMECEKGKKDKKDKTKEIR